MFPLAASQPVIESGSEVTPPVPVLKVNPATPLLEDGVQNNDESDTGSGRKAGNLFEERSACPCGKAFKYKGSFEKHRELCSYNR